MVEQRNTLSDPTQQDGTYDIIVNTSNAPKIKEYFDSSKIIQSLNKHHAAMGFKSEIDILAKSEISKYIKEKCKDLTEREIELALQNERFGEWERTESYQLFGIQYFSDIIKKYRKWKREYKRDHNIQEVNSHSSPSIDENELDKSYWSAVFDEVKKRGVCSMYYPGLFSQLKKKGKIKITKDEAELMFEMKKEELKDEAKKYKRHKTRNENKRIKLSALQENETFIDKVKEECRNDLINDYVKKFDDVDKLFLDLKNHE